ncbi:MAG: hypothetical protein JNL79_03060 [Myxococcales bacterium]|nr:hypothetical protein [Myxococcales bacterium]
MNSIPGLTALALLALPLVACGARDSHWDTPVSESSYAAARTVGLTGSVGVVDDLEHRVLLLTPRLDQELDRVFVPIGKKVQMALPSTDLSRMFVLSAGDVPRRTERDQRASLTVIEGSGEKRGTSRRYELAAPKSGVALDPLGKWVALYASGTEAFVENPNEIVLVDLESPPGADNPVTTTLRSFGGKPQKVTFSPTLNLPEGPRRLLVVQTELDVSIVDLDHARTKPRPEVTVRLSDSTSTKIIQPVQVVFDDGDSTRSDDARIGIRLANDANVVTLELAKRTSLSGENDFSPKINLTDVGGYASDIAFVRTDGGLRLAALVPTLKSAVLVQTETSLTTRVPLPAPYSRMSLITDVVSAGTPTDVALLWSGVGAGGVAFWQLGKTSGTPYRSVEVVSLPSTVSSVQDLPKPRNELKVLSMGSNSFYVLDLASRTAAPLLTQSSATIVSSPDGGRMWAYSQGGTKLSAVSLPRLHPIQLVIDRPIAAAYEVARPEGGRALVTLHTQGSFGATVFDADAPDAGSRLFSGLLLEKP